MAAGLLASIADLTAYLSVERRSGKPFAAAKTGIIHDRYHLRRMSILPFRLLLLAPQATPPEPKPAQTPTIAARKAPDTPRRVPSDCSPSPGEPVEVMPELFMAAGI